MPAHQAPSTKHQRAFTLVEMLIALALTLILVYAIAHFYAIVGDSVKDGRGMIEMNQQLRAVVQRLKDDLDHLTVPVVPWADEGGASGYFEYREGQIPPGSGGLGNAFAFPASDWDVNGNGVPDAHPPIQDPPALPPEFVDTNDDGVLDGFDMNGDGTVDVTNLLGDTDDILAMTIRAKDHNFKGQTVGVRLSDGHLLRPNMGSAPTKISNSPVVLETTSPFAEVVWWTSFSDMPDLASTASPPVGNGVWDLNEPRFLHRRQLLIRPDLNVVHPSDTDVPSTPYFVRIPVPSNAAEMSDPTRIFLYDLAQFCDISLRPLMIHANGYLYFVANSLADLSRRENRFMHQSPLVLGSFTASFPYALDLNPNFAGSLQPGLMPENPQHLATTEPRHPNPFSGNNVNGQLNATRLGASQYRWVLFDGGRKGEDIMLSNLLAFDVRVFDPDAVIRPDAPSAGTGVLQPGDPGYGYAVSNDYTNSHAPYGGSATALPTGAYVDLGYGITLTNLLTLLDPPHRISSPADGATLLFGNVFPGNLSGTINSYQPMLGQSRFANFPSMTDDVFGFAPNRGLYWSRIGYTYDTWTLAYERDGINQDGISEGAANQLIDEGRDGLDNINPITGNYENGVDDVRERETAPPYAHPLRGIQVRIRMYEPGTRQMRQATVIGDFISE